MSLGVRRGVSRWEIVSPTPGLSVKKPSGGEAEAVLVASVGCVVERPFGSFVGPGFLWLGGDKRRPQNPRLPGIMSLPW